MITDLYIGVGEAKGGFAALGVAGEVQRMRPVLDVLVAGEETCVVHCGGELADPASDVCRVPLADDGAADDGAVFQVALFLGASAGELVDREHLTGEGDRVVDGIGDEMDVVHPVGTRSVGRELADQVQGPVRLGVRGRERRRISVGHRKRPCARPEPGGEQCVGDGRSVEFRSKPGWDDPHRVGLDVHGI